MQELPKVYDPHQEEGKIYELWLEKKLFHAEPSDKKKPYCIVIPPPNITGILHMGHALNNTIQDILVRYKRMNGFETLWMPGTDHAGIATQNVVEKKLKKEGKRKEDLGREKFLEDVWKWRDEYGSTIIRQLKKLGASCDWDRTRFTMDEGLSKAVVEVFIRLHKKGLIYRGDYIINWCPRCKTALSDEEAEHKDTQGGLYYIKYPVRMKGKSTADDFVIVATTRPETMLGDVAVCVNPKDKRYKHLKDAEVILPILDRPLKVIFDRAVDTKFGTGVLKVTPAHDPVDFQLGREYGLDSINVMNDDATINSLGGEFSGMDRFTARKAVVARLEQLGLFVKQEPHAHAVGHCYRCHTMVEPRLSKQWFVRMKPLAGPALEAVKTGRIKFYPKRWTKVYTNWMENIKDWCISRQIWWGHRIPVYYCGQCVKKEEEGSGVIVSAVRPDSCPVCGSKEITQDPDVLDTWFSSWLWPFSTLGWPDKTPELEFFYPTNALVTAQEIIFFWVARMIMAGMEFMGDIPFKDIYIHGTVRDDSGTKMSKSLGNIIDPLDIIEKFGTDALRFSIISITAQGQDVFLSPQKFETGRNFANKLWNASRFMLMNLKEDLLASSSSLEDVRKDMTLADKWIVSRFNQAASDFARSIESFKINDAANRIYDFIWHEFCDWYVELAKINIDSPATQRTLLEVLRGSLAVLHPIMPFITEAIWQKLPGNDEGTSIMISSWPAVKKAYVSKKTDSEMGLLINIIQAIRNIRATWRIEPSAFVDVSVAVKAEKDGKNILCNKGYIARLAKVKELDLLKGSSRPGQSALAVIGDIEILVPRAGVIDLAKERERINGKIGELENYLRTVNGKLNNPSFVDRAPKDVVAKEQEKKAMIESELEGLKKNLASLE